MTLSDINLDIPSLLRASSLQDGGMAKYRAGLVGEYRFGESEEKGVGDTLKEKGINTSKNSLQVWALYELKLT